MSLTPPNPIAGIGDGCAPEFIEMIRVGANHKSGSARFWGR